MTQVGRTSAMTVISVVPWWWALWLRNIWRLAGIVRRLRGRVSKKDKRMIRIASILFAHWGLLERMPPGRPKRASKPFPGRLSYLVFQSNYNGNRETYLEVFSVAVLWKMRAVWKGAYGVPDLIPVGPFAEYAAEEDLPVAHFYTAYPNGSAKIIGAALEVRKRYDEFAATASGLPPEKFEEAYDEFMRECHLSL